MVFYSTVFIFIIVFIFVVLVLSIQIATQESAGEAPAPTALCKLLPNKNNLCAGCRLSLGDWRGRRTVERQEEGFILMVNNIFFFFLHYPDRPPAWNPKLQKWRCSRSICHFLPCSLSSLTSRFQLWFHSEAFPTETLLLLPWMVSKMLKYFVFFWHLVFLDIFVSSE